MIYDIKPVPKPRMTQSDKWKKRDTVLRYRAFVDECRLKNVELPESGSHIVFRIRMPLSWSKKKKDQHRGMKHQSRPDLSNLLKALEDALYLEDSHIYDYRATKLWDDTGSIEIKSINILQ